MVRVMVGLKQADHDAVDIHLDERASRLTGLVLSERNDDLRLPVDPLGDATGVVAGHEGGIETVRFDVNPVLVRVPRERLHRAHRRPGGRTAERRPGSSRTTRLPDRSPAAPGGVQLPDASSSGLVAPGERGESPIDGNIRAGDVAGELVAEQHGDDLRHAHADRPSRRSLPSARRLGVRARRRGIAELENPGTMGPGSAASGAASNPSASLTRKRGS